MSDQAELAIIGAAAIEYGEQKSKLRSRLKTLSDYREHLYYASESLKLLDYRSFDSAGFLFGQQRVGGIPTSEMVLAVIDEIHATRTRIEQLEESLRAAGAID